MSVCGWGFLVCFLIFFGVQFVYNVVLVSGTQQSESVICIFTLFQILFLV